MGPYLSPPQIVEYQLIGLAEAEAKQLTVGNVRGGCRMVASIAGTAPATLEVPEISFGDVNPAEAARPIRQDPDPFQCPRSTSVGPFPAFEIRDAVVHTNYGIVTSGSFLFTDTLYHVPLHLIPGASRTDGGVVLPEFQKGEPLEKAVHLMAGGADNYFHWLIDALSRVELDRYGHSSRQPDRDGPLLLPGLRFETGVEFPPAFQSESLRWLLHPSAPRRLISSRECIAVGCLRYSQNMSGVGFSPHPDILKAFDALIAAVLGDAVHTAARRKIYVSRQETKQRRMSNESEVIDLMKSSGFEIIEPGKLSVAEQIRVFHDASHVVGPHGAGLTNILFCRPGTVVCELHMDGYVQWAMRCLAALRQVNYGCLIGLANEIWHDWPHVNSWTAPINRLAKILKGPPFS